MGASEHVAARRAEMYELYLGGRTQQDLANQFGISRQTVSADLAAHRASLPLPSVDDIRKNHADLLERMRKSMIELVEKEGAPITAGKDGTVVFDPVTCAPVRDYSLRVQAQRELLKIIEREAKQFGSDAAAKVEVSGEVAVVDSVNAELSKLAEQLGLQTPTVPGISAADGLTEPV